jgi:hypothetical protein
MWITGFVDGEGSFYIKITTSLTHKAGWSVQACFSIGLHKKDKALLELIRLSLGGVGKIYSTNNTAYYEVRSIKELTEVIIPHFVRSAERGARSKVPAYHTKKGWLWAFQTSC